MQSRRVAVLLTCATATAMHVPALRTVGRHGYSMVSMHAAEPSPSDILQQTVQYLADAGLTKAEIETGFDQALENAVFPPAPSPSPSPLQGKAGTDPVKPTTITDAKRAFRGAYTGGPFTPPILKFTDVIVETTCVYKFQYSRVYAVGLTALCDTFLSACRTPQDQEATRTALCFGIGLDAERVRCDAEQLSNLAASMSGAELLAGEDMSMIAQDAGFKYTYPFGVGLIILMKSTGDLPTADSITRWCTALNLNCARTLERDFSRPVSIDGIGRYSFDTPGIAVPPALDSIGETGSY